MAAELVADSAEPDERPVVHQRERKAQFLVFEDIVSDPGEPARPAPVRLDHVPEATRLLASIGRQDEIDRLTMLALADALEEAGCMERALLEHCRQLGTHRRGCWVIERLYGREMLRLPVPREERTPVRWP
jgi:hypothetical protein